MTLNEMKELIRKTAAEYGFEAEDQKWSELPQIKRYPEDYISISIRDKWDGFNFQTKEATIKVEVSSSVCQMGGNPTPAELIAAAAQIKRGAELTAKLQGMNLEYKRPA